MECCTRVHRFAMILPESWRCRTARLWAKRNKVIEMYDVSEAGQNLLKATWWDFISSESIAGTLEDNSLDVIGTEAKEHFYCQRLGLLLIYARAKCLKVRNEKRRSTKKGAFIFTTKNVFGWFERRKATDKWRMAGRSVPSVINWPSSLTSWEMPLDFVTGGRRHGENENKIFGRNKSKNWCRAQEELDGDNSSIDH